MQPLFPPQNGKRRYHSPEDMMFHQMPRVKIEPISCHIVAYQDMIIGRRLDWFDSIRLKVHKGSTLTHFTNQRFRIESSDCVQDYITNIMFGSVSFDANEPKLYMATIDDSRYRLVSSPLSQPNGHCSHCSRAMVRLHNRTMTAIWRWQRKLERRTIKHITGFPLPYF